MVYGMVYYILLSRALTLSVACDNRKEKVQDNLLRFQHHKTSARAIGFSRRKQPTHGFDAERREEIIK